MPRPKIFVFQSLPSEQIQHQLSTWVSNLGVKTLLLSDREPHWYVSMLQTLGVHPVVLSMDFCPQLAKNSDVQLLNSTNWMRIQEVLESHLGFKAA